MSQHHQYRDRTIHQAAHGTRNLLAAALALALASAVGAAQAATQLVTNCNDGGSGSMRAAITAAMSGDIVDAKGLTCSTISLSTGALAVTANTLTVKGAGPTRLTVTNGAKYGRVLRHEGNGTLTLKGMTITSGVVSPAATESGTQGGCVYSKGAVTLGNIFAPTDAVSGVVVSDCTAVSTQAGVGAQGGGVFAQKGVGLANSKVTHARAIAQDSATISQGGGVFVSNGPLAMKYSEVSISSASGSNGFGGGIDAEFADNVTVSHSTIADNTASGRAGGAFLGTRNGGLLEIDNSTISGNSSAGEGGVLLNVLASTTPGAIHIYSSTVTGNRSSSTISGVVGGASVGGDFILQSTIVSGNLRNGVNSDLFINGGRTVTGANNLVGVSKNAPPPVSGLITTTDPKLGPLTNRGGFTRVHLPLTNSPAINAGNNVFNSTTDQRGPGFPRVIGSAADIGAAEYDPDRIFNNGFD